jgi:hypothetical protein
MMLAGDDIASAGRGTDDVDGGDGFDECYDAETTANCEIVSP